MVPKISVLQCHPRVFRNLDPLSQAQQELAESRAEVMSRLEDGASRVREMETRMATVAVASTAHMAAIESKAANAASAAMVSSQGHIRVCTTADEWVRLLGTASTLVQNTVFADADVWGHLGAATRYSQ